MSDSDDETLPDTADRLAVRFECANQCCALYHRDRLTKHGIQDRTVYYEEQGHDVTVTRVE